MKSSIPNPQRLFAGRIACLFALLVVGALPSTVFAASVLEIFDINTKEVESSFTDSEGASAKISIYFSARQSNGEPIAGLKAENFTLLIDKEEPELASIGLRSFKDGDRSVAVVVVFPIAKDYIEEFFGIRSNLKIFVDQFRNVDWVGAVAYDSQPRNLNPVTGADIPSLATSIEAIENSEVIEPNLFGALPPAVAMLKGIEGVKLKYLIVVSNAEGAVVGDDKQANKRIQQFQATVKKQGIRPMIVGYTPDGPEELTYRKWLQQLAVGGSYVEATSSDELPGALQKVYDQIFQQYILDAEVDLSGEYWLEEGKYSFTLVAKVGSQELKSSDKAPWPLLEQDKSWIIWLIVGVVGGLIFLALLIVIIVKVSRARRESVQEMPGMMPMEMQPQRPQEYKCETCGKTIPEVLFGFQNEFCLDGAKPDCPYYQMPDRGRLTVNKGPLADITFFIKEEMTTVGSFIENSVALIDKSVSKKHAAIKVDEGNRYELRDFGSTNGTYVNGERIQRKFLRDGDTLLFGGVEVTFHLK